MVMRHGGQRPNEPADYEQYGAYSPRHEVVPRERAPLDAQVREPPIGVAEPLKLNAHSVHERQIQAASAAVVIATVQIIEHAAGLDCAATAARQKDRHMSGLVLVAVEQVRHA